jgi:hypothetical protein
MPGGWVLCVLLAQAGQAGPDVTDVERIRKALEEPAPALTDAVQREGLVFRVTIRAMTPRQPPWEDWSHVPTFVRPWWKVQQYEYLEQVTPVEFRTGTLYPVGIPVVPLVQWIAKKAGEANRKSNARKAREEVRRDLEQFLACQADPSKPGC